MTDIATAIDDYTKDYFNTSPDYDLMAYGLCEQMKKTSGGNEQPIIVTIANNREQVCINDRFEVITWLRLTGQVNYEQNEEWSFGKNEARYANIVLRMFFAHRVEMGENVVFDFVHNLPSKLLVPDYKFVFISPVQNVDTDHEAVFISELGNVAYEKHRVRWNVYAVNLNLQAIICPGDYRLLEDGSLRLVNDNGLRILE